MANKQQPKDIQSKTLLMLRRDIYQEGQKCTEIRVVEWSIGGKRYPQLEKREMFMSDDGEWKIGKAKGLAKKDLELIQDKWGEVMEALGGQPSAKAQPVAAADAPPPATSLVREDF